MRWFKTSRLIRIYTICHSFIVFLLKPYFQHQICPHSEMEESITETQGEKVLFESGFNDMSILVGRVISQRKGEER